jgi:hypothetical protein
MKRQVFNALITPLYTQALSKDIPLIHSALKAHFQLQQRGR